MTIALCLPILTPITANRVKTSLGVDVSQESLGLTLYRGMRDVLGYYYSTLVTCPYRPDVLCTRDQPRPLFFPCDLSRAAWKMRSLVLLAALLLVLPAEGIFEALANPRPGPNRHDPAKTQRVGRSNEAVTMCPNFPLPAVGASEVLAKLQPFLEAVVKNVSAALEKDKSPGGVALGVVYNDTLIWSKGFGLINQSGKTSTLSKRRAINSSVLCSTVSIHSI